MNVSLPKKLGAHVRLDNVGGATLDVPESFKAKARAFAVADTLLIFRKEEKDQYIAATLVALELSPAELDTTKELWTNNAVGWRVRGEWKPRVLYLAGDVTLQDGASYVSPGMTYDAKWRPISKGSD